MPEDDADTVFCTECGTEIARSAKFCPECGADQPVTGTGETAAGAAGGAAGTAERATGPDGDRGGTASATGADGGGTTQSGSALQRLPGFDEGNTTRRNVLVGAGYSVVGLAAIGAIAGPADNGTGASGGNGGQYPNAWAYDQGTGIALRSVEGEVQQFSVRIRGAATNESNRDYSYVQLGFGLYDASGTKVGDALANTSGLAAGQRWRFEAIGMNAESVDSFDVEDITAY